VGAVQKVLSSHFRERDKLEPVTRKELLSRIQHGPVTVIDARPSEEFDVGHLPGALNVPCAISNVSCVNCLATRRSLLTVAAHIAFDNAAWPTLE
jgi:rhodanese-related sulfurtransferase